MADNPQGYNPIDPRVTIGHVHLKVPISNARPRSSGPRRRGDRRAMPAANCPMPTLGSAWPGTCGDHVETWSFPAKVSLHPTPWSVRSGHYPASSRLVSPEDGRDVASQGRMVVHRVRVHGARPALCCSSRGDTVASFDRPPTWPRTPLAGQALRPQALPGRLRRLTSTRGRHSRPSDFPLRSGE